MTSNHPNRSRSRAEDNKVIYSCTDGFHEPLPDCNACAGTGFVPMHWRDSLQVHAKKQLGIAITVLGHEAVFNIIATGLDTAARGTSNTILASNYQHMATRLRDFAPDLRALKL